MKITKEEKAELSKYVHKYIYHIYTKSGVFHCERFPIVYINSDYVYFKTSGVKLLEHCKVENVIKPYSTSDLKFTSSIFGDYFSKYYLDISEFSAEDAKEFLENNKTNRNIEYVEQEFKVAEKIYLDKKSKYEKLLAAKNEVKDVKVTITPEFGCVFDE